MHIQALLDAQDPWLGENQYQRIKNSEQDISRESMALWEPKEPVNPPFTDGSTMWNPSYNIKVRRGSPACQNCTSTGRVCDGYVQVPDKRTHAWRKAEKPHSGDQTAMSGDIKPHIPLIRMLWFAWSIQVRFISTGPSAGTWIISDGTPMPANHSGVCWYIRCAKAHLADLHTQ